MADPACPHTLHDLKPPRKEGELQHLAIIMDGNRRWARKQGLPAVEGYRRGLNALKETVRAAEHAGIPYLSVWAFATDNWKRPAHEIAGLMDLMRLVLRRDIAEMHKNGLRLRFIGNRSELDPDIVTLMAQAETLTQSNAGLTLIVAFNYGFRTDMTRAVQELAGQVARGEICPTSITASKIAQTLETAPYPDPDLLIRTSGEQRLSNYMLWELAYTELYFTPIYWPDFGQNQLRDALAAFETRQRRFGGNG